METRHALVFAGSALLAACALVACGSSEEEAAASVAEPTESATVAGAGEATDTTPADFEAALQEASDRAERALNDAIAPAFEPIAQASTSTELPDAPLPGAFEENLPRARAALDAYALEVEALEAPEEFRADKERHLGGLREVAEHFDELIAADAARDRAQVDALLRELDSVFRNLAVDLSPEYAALAFMGLGPVEAEEFGDLSLEERDDLDGVDRAQEEFASRNFEFAAAIRQAYTSQELLLRALYEAGAGQAWQAVLDVADTLEPLPSFEADHELWLALLEELVEIDRLIGEAARDGDMVNFEVNNPRLRLAQGRVAGDFSPAFAAGIGLGPVGCPDPDAPQQGLDPESAIAGTAYGQDLYEALRASESVLPLDLDYKFFPMTSDEAVLEAIPQIATDVIAVLEERRAAVAELSPSPEYAVDRERIVQFFDELIDNQEVVIAAAESGDVAAARDAIAAGLEPYCAIAEELSAEVRPAARLFDLVMPEMCPT
jgi:hypothetical protein